MIPMVDLKTQYLNLKDEMDAAVLDVLDSTRFILGPNVHAFEEECAQYLGVKHALTCASGTDALHLALLAAGIKEGDEVITSPFTFIATAEAIRYVGAEPIFVDIDSKTFNLDLDKVEAAITDKTTAIMPVHLFGQPVDMARLNAICEGKNLKIIEDCAQSFGAHIDGKQTGSFGVANGFSFFPSKNLGAYGDGGLVTTDSDEIAAKIKQYRNHGSAQRYHHDVIGYNSRLDEMQAAILRVKMKHIDSFNSERRRVAQGYNAGLADTPIQTATEDGIGYHVFHQYTLLAETNEQRETILAALRAENIGCAVYYPIPLHQQKAFLVNGEASISLPIVEDVSQRCFSLPIYPEMSDESVAKVVEVIKSAL